MSIAFLRIFHKNIDFSMLYAYNNNMKESSIEGRAFLLRKALKLNQTEFAEKLGLTQTTVSGWGIGKSQITEQNINLICLTFGVCKEWLKEGEGEMFVANNGNDLECLLSIYKRLSETGKDDVLWYTEKVLQREEEKSALQGLSPPAPEEAAPASPSDISKRATENDTFYSTKTG
jgi:transcriptional regulator with XRE-family HTH domain